MTKDFFQVNTEQITIVKGDRLKGDDPSSLLLDFTVNQGETLHLSVKLDSHQNGHNNGMEVWLVKEGRYVAMSYDDGDGGDDNSVVVLQYREQVDADSSFAVRAVGWQYAHTVDVGHLQMGYTTYGPGHAFIVDTDSDELDTPL